MNKQTNTTGLRRSKTGSLWALSLLVGSAFIFSGCSSTPSMSEKPDELAKLPQWPQVAYVLEMPLKLVGWALIIWACNGGSIISKTITYKKEERE